MAIETQVQEGPLMAFIQDQTNGLGYEKKLPSTIGNNLIIKEDIIRILQLEDNIKNYKSVLKNHYKGDQELFHKEFIDFYHDRAYKPRNTAIFFSSNKSLVFKEHRFTIFFTSGSKIHGDANFDKNIFSVVSELTYKVKEDLPHLFNKRPDLAFFLNGVLISYCEFKYNNRGQSAYKEGRNKVIKDYIDAVSDFALPLEKTYQLHGEDFIKAKRESFLKLFEKVAHITSFDLNNMFAIRDLSTYQDQVLTRARTGKTDYSDLFEKITKNSFHQVPHDKEEYDPDKYKDYLRMFYSKKNIETEILYYNFLKYSKDKDNKNQGTGSLISPRPKQKFGVDKVIERTSVLYDNELNPNFMEQELIEKFGKSIAERVLEDRKQLKKNKDTNSLLLQYAAGFGKTMIMCWLALRLKDMEKESNSLFNKVLLVSDRVELRSQVEGTIQNMNIEKSLFQEATNKETFLNALNNESTRIIIVNIQKFNTISENLNDEDKEKLANNRVAFIIDEVHRSQSGTQNEKMTNLFEDLMHTVESYSAGNKKKNLIIGLTATPSPDITSRFGEITNNNSKDGWGYKPFDAFTMKDAIEAGFILNPTDKIFSCEPKVYYEELENDNQRLPNKKEIYEDSRRVQIISKQIAQILFKDTFKKIGGRGKGMLTCASIAAAIKYKGELEIALREEKERLDSKYEPKVFIVYSRGNQDQKDPKMLNKYIDKNGNEKHLDEPEVIETFKKERHSIIVVVDKLQTGFDDPYLHTLFLDKEITGINAVQTLCRVNRTTKLKDSCLVVDFSINGINRLNIKDAFEMYETLAVNDLNLNNIQISLANYYNSVITNEIYVKHIKEFEECFNPTTDMAFARKIRESSPDLIKDLLTANREMNKLASGYMAIIDLDKRYFDPKLSKFVETVYNIVKTTTERDNKIAIDFDIEDNLTMFELLLDQIAESEEENKNSSSGKGNSGEMSDEDYIERMNRLIEELNDLENLKEDSYLRFKETMSLLVEEMSTNAQYADTIRRIKEYDTELTDEIKAEMLLMVKKIGRRKKKEEAYQPKFFDYFNTLDEMFVENIFLFLKGKKETIL